MKKYINKRKGYKTGPTSYFNFFFSFYKVGFTLKKWHKTVKTDPKKKKKKKKLYKKSQKVVVNGHNLKKYIMCIDFGHHIHIHGLLLLFFKIQYNFNLW